MTLSADPAVSGTLSLADFIEHLERNVALDDPLSLIDAAGHFRALANDADLVANHLSLQIRSYFDTGRMATNGPQSILLGRGHGFFLRANIWLPLGIEGPFRAHEERLYSYDTTHDHNFGFMTVGYFGPGYTTDLYRYDPNRVEGYVGELVDLEYKGCAQLTPGRVMVYEEKRDVHLQHPPKSLSVSLNVVVTSHRTQELDQYFFDRQQGRIVGMPDFASIHQRATVVTLAANFGNDDTVALLVDLLRQAPCRRVRQAALEGISTSTLLGDIERNRIVEGAIADPDLQVRSKARGMLRL